VNHAYSSNAIEACASGALGEVSVDEERARGRIVAVDSGRGMAPQRKPGRRIVGASQPIQQLLAHVARVAPKDITVLVRGETGTGKDLVASRLHEQSGRAEGPYVAFNCAAVPADLAESELFGHARGAFTGATQARRGFFAQADGGTLVLDEIGELPVAMQAKLLRALQEGEIQPVGSGRPELVDVRIIASTNRDLEAEVRAGRFRDDLYYRLTVIELVVPPLRDHSEDIPKLATEFARRYAERFHMDDVRLSPALIEKLTRAAWPGNVRQLENCVARLVALSSGAEIGPEAFDEAPVVVEAGELAAQGDRLTLKQQVAAFERSLVTRALAASSGNQSEAARRLQISRSALIDRVRKYGLHGPPCTRSPQQVPARRRANPTVRRRIPRRDSPSTYV
jgi:two-component system response regulator AtoC